MDKKKLISVLQQVQNNSISIDEAYNTINLLPYDDLGYAKIDYYRTFTTNFPEVILCQGKTTEQIVNILKTVSHTYSAFLATRANQKIYDEVQKIIPDAMYNELARVIYRKGANTEELGVVSVVTAGTADIPVAEEAAICLEVMGVTVNKIYDVGVAGIHRLIDKLQVINKSKVVIVVAGMEGALASVVGGLTSKPVIGVPTSVGYGANFNGLSALLSMLNTCANGVGVVNIDNGYGAAALAFSIVNTIYDG